MMVGGELEAQKEAKDVEAQGRAKSIADVIMCRQCDQ